MQRLPWRVANVRRPTAVVVVGRKEKPHVNHRRSLARLFALMWPEEQTRLLGLLMMTLATGLLAPASVWLTKLLLDAVSTSGSGDGSSRAYVVPIALGLGGVAALLAILPILNSYITEDLARRVSYRADELLSGKLTSLDGLASFEDPALHNRIRLAQQGSESAPPLIVSSATTLARQTLSLVGFILAAAAVSVPIAALVLLATAPALAAELSFARRRVRLAFQLTASERRRMFFNVLQTDTSAAKEIRLFAAGQFVRRRLLAEHATQNTHERELAAQIARSRVLLASIGAVGAAAALALAARGAVNGTLTVGDVTVALAAVPGVQLAASGLIDAISRVSTASLTFGYLVEVLEAEPDMPTAPGPRPVLPLMHAIEFRDVWFRYNQNTAWVFTGLDLTVPAGRTLAVVGSNGAGKSTLIKLLLRFYDPDRGVVLWDGTDIREFDLSDLRGRVTAVFQDYVQYDLTAAENIALSDTSCPDVRQRVTVAAQAAGISNAIETLPHGYDTMLSRTFEGLQSESVGVELSGGQWQRIALARMYLRSEAEVFLLDEPTAALDAEAEHQLYQHFGDLMAGRTNIVISHRIVSTRSADLVAVIDNGRVAEQGSPEDLLQAGGLYARYNRLQQRLGVDAT